MWATVPAPPPAVTASLDELRTQPARFEGQKVRVAGQTTQCFNFTCALCPLEATREAPQWDQCLALDFDRMRGGERYGYNFDPAYRLSDVILTATFRGGCLRGVACTDKGTVLDEAKVEAVTRRRSSRDGLAEGDSDTLLKAPATVDAALTAKARTAVEHGENAAFKAFALHDQPMATTRAVVCRYRVYASSAEIRWPETGSQALLWPSAVDGWKCWRARRLDGDWIIDPG